MDHSNVGPKLRVLADCTKGKGMHLLLIHQNFPGQFRDLAPAWLAAGHQITALGSCSDAPEGKAWEGLRYLRYHLKNDDAPSAEQRGAAVAEICRHLLARDQAPDLVLVHTAWGEALGLNTIWPDRPLITFPELWGSPLALGYGFDQSIGGNWPDPELFIEQNNLARQGIETASVSMVASPSQRDSFPPDLQQQLRVLPEGVDLEAISPNPAAQLLLNGRPIRAGDPLVTLVSRELEPLRGLRQVLWAWPAVSAALPDANLLLVGGDDGGYGLEEPRSDSHLNDAFLALPAEVNRSRIHVVGWLEHEEMLTVLQCSACHLALSYPYTLSWSVLEAMACAAPLISNPGSPISASIRDGANGVLVPFNDHHQLAEAIIRMLKEPNKRRALGQAARRTVEQHFNLRHTLPRYQALFEELTAAERSSNH